MIDPSGHVGVCFYGGTEEGGNSSTHEMCNQLSQDDNFKDQTWKTFSPLKDGKDGAVQLIQEELNKNPNQPVIIIGYSSGGAAALEVADQLNSNWLYEASSGYFGKAPTSIDNLVLIDPENTGRFMGDPSTLIWGTPGEVPSNVERALNYYTNNSVEFPGGSSLSRAKNEIKNSNWNGAGYQLFGPKISDGMPPIEGAWNVDVSKQYQWSGKIDRPTHYTMMNQQTYDDARLFLLGAATLQGQPSQ